MCDGHNWRKGLRGGGLGGGGVCGWVQLEHCFSHRFSTLAEGLSYVMWVTNVPWQVLAHNGRDSFPDRVYLAHRTPWIPHKDATKFIWSASAARNRILTTVCLITPVVTIRFSVALYWFVQAFSSWSTVYLGVVTITVSCKRQQINNSVSDDQPPLSIWPLSLSE